MIYPGRLRFALAIALGAFVFSLQANSQVADCPKAPAHIHIESGDYSSRPGITFQLKHFAATLVPLGKTAPLCLKHMTVVSHAEIFVSNESLTSLFDEKLAGADSKIKNFKVQNGEGKVTLNGKITKIIPIEFTIQGPVTTDGSLIILRAEKIKADGIPIKALLQVVGDHLSSVLKVKNVKGIEVRENDLTFSPEQIAHLRGYIQAVESSPTGLLLRFGKSPAGHHSTSRTLQTVSK